MNLDNRAITDLLDGTRIENGDKTVILGDNNTVAFKFGKNAWQVATDVYFDNVPGVDLDGVLNRAAILAVANRAFPEGVSRIYYSDEVDNAVVRTLDGDLVTVWSDGSVVPN